MARRRARRGHSLSGEAGAGRERLTAASRGATPTARAVTRALPGSSSPRATRRARRLLQLPGLRAPGKRPHTCALRPAPAAHTRQGGQEGGRAWGRKVCLPGQSRGGPTPLSGSRPDGRAEEGSGGRGAREGIALLGQSSGSREWPLGATWVTRGLLGRKKGVGGGGAGEG